MAEQIIDIPGVGEVSFPDGMSDADIAKAAGRLHGDAQAAAAQRRLTADPEGGGAIERTIKGFARTNPLTGLYNLLTTNPLTTLKGIGQSHLDEGAKTIDALKRLIVDRDPLALSEAVGHGVATLTPLVGPAAAHAGELIGSGDVAGGLGETTGLLMGVPSVGGRVVQGLGKTASKVAPLVKTPARWGAGGALLHGNPVAAAATYVAPALLEHGGRFLERVGTGIRESAPGPTLSLRRLLGQEPVVVDPYAPNVSGYRPGAPASDLAVGAPEAAVDVDPYAPNEPGYTGPSSSDVAVGTSYEPTVQRYAPNEPGYGGPGSRGTTRFAGAQDFQPSVDPYAPNTSGYGEPGAAASDVAVGAPYDPVIDPYAPNISGYDPAAPASDLAVGEPYVSPATEILSQRSGAPRAVARPLNLTENLQARVAEPPAAPGEAITPELVDESRMPDALLTAEEKAARDAKSMDRTYQLADAGMKGADYAKAKFGTDYWPNLTDAQRAEVAAYERSLTGGVDVEAGQINQMVDATTRETFGRAYEDLLPHEQRSVDVLRSRLTGTDTPVTPTQKLAPAPETQIGIAPPDEGWITPGETLQSVGAPTPTGGRGFWSGLRRGDLWPQLQEEMLSTAEGPAPSSAAPPKSPGRTGPGAQGKGGRFAPKATAAPADVAPATTPAQAELVNDVRTTALKGRKAPAAQKAPANPDWPWKLDEATGEWIETRPPVTTSARPTRARRAPTSAAKVRADTTSPPTPTDVEPSSFEPPPPTQQEYIAEATRSLKEAKMPVPPDVADGTRMLSDEEMNQLAVRSRRNPRITLPVEWK